MERELIEYLVEVDSLGMKGIKTEVQEALRDLADCVQKTESEAKARMHVCVDQNNLEPMMRLSKLCTNCKALADNIVEISKTDSTKAENTETETSEESDKAEEKEPPKKEEQSEEKKEPEIKPVVKMDDFPVQAESDSDSAKGKLTVSYLHRTPIALEINRTKHNLSDKTYRGLLETLMKVQATRDGNSLRGWINAWQRNGNKQITFSNKFVNDADVFIPELKTYANINGSDEVMINAIIDLIDVCNLQDLYWVYYAPVK